MARDNDGIDAPWSWGVLVSMGIAVGVYLAVCWFLAHATQTIACVHRYPTPAELCYPDAQLLSLRDKIR